MQDTEASKKALKEAEQAEEAKKQKWSEAEAAGRHADQFASKKLDDVEGKLNAQMASLSTKAQVLTCLAASFRHCPSSPD